MSVRIFQVGRSHHVNFVELDSRSFHTSSTYFIVLVALLPLKLESKKKQHDVLVKICGNGLKITEVFSMCSIELAIMLCTSN